MAREVKRVLHVETTTHARELLAVMQTLVSSEAWALFVQLVEAAYSDEAFAGQATTIISAEGPIERKMAELVGQRKAARYLLSLPVQIINQCRSMIDEGNRGDVADSAGSG
jgi:hypothetical protein